MQAELELDRNRITLASFEFPELGPRQNFRGPTVRGVLPHNGRHTFRLRLRVAAQPELDSEYTFVCWAAKGSAAESRALSS